MKKIISLVLSFVCLVTMCMPAFAAETSTSNELPAPTLEEAAEYLGVDVSDLEGLEVRRLSDLNESRISSGIPTYLTSGVYYEDFNADNFTGAMHYINGKRFKWTAVLQKVIKTYPVTFGAQLWFGDSNKFPDSVHTLYEEGDSYQSGWYDVSYGEGIYFKYYLSGYPTDTISVRMIIGVV